MLLQCVVLCSLLAIVVVSVASISPLGVHPLGYFFDDSYLYIDKSEFFLLCLCSLFLTYFFVVVRQMKNISTQILSNAKMAPNLSLKIVSTTTSAIVSMAPMSLVLTCYSTPLILDSRELRWDFNSCPDKDFWVELIESFYIYRLQFWKKCVFWDAKLVSFWISSAV